MCLYLGSHESQRKKTLFGMLITFVTFSYRLYNGFWLWIPVKIKKNMFVSWQPWQPEKKTLFRMLRTFVTFLCRLYNSFWFCIPVKNYLKNVCIFAAMTAREKTLFRMLRTFVTFLYRLYNFLWLWIPVKIKKNMFVSLQPWEPEKKQTFFSKFLLEFRVRNLCITYTRKFQKFWGLRTVFFSLLAMIYKLS